MGVPTTSKGQHCWAQTLSSAYFSATALSTQLGSAPWRDVAQSLSIIVLNILHFCTTIQNTWYSTEHCPTCCGNKIIQMKVILKKDLNSSQLFLHVEIPFLSLLCHLCAQKQQSLSTRRCSVVVLMLVSNTCTIHVFCSVCVLLTLVCVCVCVC